MILILLLALLDSCYCLYFSLPLLLLSCYGFGLSGISIHVLFVRWTCSCENRYFSVDVSLRSFFLLYSSLQKSSLMTGPSPLTAIIFYGLGPSSSGLDFELVRPTRAGSYFLKLDRGREGGRFRGPNLGRFIVNEPIAPGKSRKDWLNWIYEFFLKSRV